MPYIAPASEDFAINTSEINGLGFRGLNSGFRVQGFYKDHKGMTLVTTQAMYQTCIRIIYLEHFW